jgi:F-type H+-transporting ATPase subunit delta
VSTTTHTTLADQTYARALLSLADEAGQLEAVAQELAGVAVLLVEQPQLQRLFSSPLVGKGDRAGSIDRLFKGRVSDVLLRFLQVLNRKGRLGELSGIARAFKTLLDQKQGRIEVDAYVATPLDAAAQARVAEGIGAALGKTVQLQQHVDDSLIGGMKVRVGDQLIDATVATQLRLIREKLIAAGRDKARAAAASL